MSHQSSGYSAGNGNPFAGLDGMKSPPAAPSAQPKKKQQTSAGPASSSASGELTPEQLEKRRQKNREKRLRKKAAAAANDVQAASDDEDGSEAEAAEQVSSADQTVPSAASSSPPTPTVSVPSSPSRRARPSPLSVAEEAKRQAAQKVERVPTPRVGDLTATTSRSHDDLALQPKVEEESDEEEIDSPVPTRASHATKAKKIESSSSEEEVDESEEDDAEESNDEPAAVAESSSEEEEASDASSPAPSSEEEEEPEEEEEEESEVDEDSPEHIDAQVISLGYAPDLVAAARAQLVSNGIPVDTELLLIAVQEADALAKERASGKITVFKKPPPKKPAAAPAPAAKTTVAKPAQPAPVANGKAAPVVAAKQPASTATKPAPATAAATATQTKKEAAAAVKEAQAIAKLNKAKPTATADAHEEKYPAPPANKLTPHRSVPASNTFESESEHTHSSVGLDAQAKTFSPSSDAAGAILTLNGWSDQLEQAALAGFGNTTKTASEEAKEFAHAFKESNALEIVLKTCMQEVWGASTTPVEPSKVKSLDQAILRLFTLTLSGKPADHRFLLDSFRNISKLLSQSTPSARPALQEKVLKVLTAARRVTAVHEQIGEAMKEEEKVALAKKPGGAGAFGQNGKLHDESLAPLQQLQLDTALLFGESHSTSSHSNTSTSTPLKKMWTSFHSQSQSLSTSEEILTKFSSILLKSPGHSLQLTFHLLEREIQDSMMLCQKNLEAHTGQNALVTSQRLALEQNKSKELTTLQTQQKEQSQKEKDLLKRKSELLNELDRINAQLKTLEIQKTKTQSSVQAIETQYAKNVASLTELHSKTHSTESALKSDVNAAGQVHSLIVGTYERLTVFNQATLQRLVNTNATATSTYLKACGETLGQERELVEFLSSRVAFVTKKLTSFSQEKSEALKYGVHTLTEPPAESEKSLRETIRQDQKLIQHLKTQASTLVRKLSKQSLFGLPADQVVSLYSSLVSSLEAKKVGETFDIKPLKEQLEKLKEKATPAPTANGSSDKATHPSQPPQTTVQKQAKAASAAAAAVVALAAQPSTPAPATTSAATTTPTQKPAKAPLAKNPVPVKNEKPPSVPAAAPSTTPVTVASKPATTPVAATPSATTSASNATTVDPFTGLEALPQRVNKRKDRTAAGKTATTEATPVPVAAVEAPATNGDSTLNGAKKGKGKKGVAAVGSALSVPVSSASVSPLPSPPVKTWSTTMVAPIPTSGDESFPVLSAATIAQVKQQERVAKKTILSLSPSPVQEKSSHENGAAAISVEEKKSD